MATPAASSSSAAPPDPKQQALENYRKVRFLRCLCSPRVHSSHLPIALQKIKEHETLTEQLKNCPSAFSSFSPVLILTLPSQCERASRASRRTLRSPRRTSRHSRVSDRLSARFSACLTLNAVSPLSFSVAPSFRVLNRRQNSHRQGFFWAEICRRLPICCRQDQAQAWCACQSRHDHPHHNAVGSFFNWPIQPILSNPQVVCAVQNSSKRGRSSCVQHVYGGSRRCDVCRYWRSRRTDP
jgi:hypothetical protein